MRQVVRVGTLALLLAAGWIAPAEAAWGWLERLSGPGPFDGPQYAFRVACYGFPDNDQGQGALGSREQATRDEGEPPRLYPFWRCWQADPHQMRVDLGVDVASLTTDENPLTYSDLDGARKPGVRAFLLVPYASVSLGIAFEAGVGAGFLRLTDHESDIDFSSTKFVVQPLRLTIKPLAPFSRSRRFEALQIAFNGTLIAGTLEDTDFGAVPGTFRERMEMLWQTELRLDIGLLASPGPPRSRRR
jgi:hypothetical protein